MELVLRNGAFSSDAPEGYIPKDGEVCKAVNKDTGDEAIVVVKKDGPQGGGCGGCIANIDRWDAARCTHVSCGKYDFKLIDINDIMENI